MALYNTIIVIKVDELGNVPLCSSETIWRREQWGLYEKYTVTTKRHRGYFLDGPPLIGDHGKQETITW